MGGAKYEIDVVLKGGGGRPPPYEKHKIQNEQPEWSLINRKSVLGG